MNREQKQAMIQSLEHDLQNSQSSFLIGVKGLTVSEIQGLRKGLHQQGGRLRVAKNTLLRRAVESNPELNHLVPFFKEQIAVVFANQTPEVAKLLFQATQSYEHLTLIAGALETKPLTKLQIEHLATLPSKEVLLAQVAGAMKAPVTAYVSVLNQLVLRFLWVLKKIEEKKQ